MTSGIDDLLGKAIDKFQNGDPHKAEEFLLQVLEVDEYNLPALEIISFIKSSLGNHSDAKKYLGKLIQLNPNNSNALRLLGVGFAHQKMWIEAIDYFNKSVKANPNNGVAYSNLGNALLELRRNEEALTAYEKATSIDPGYAEGWSNKGNALFKLKRYDEGLAAYDKAISINPGYLEAMSNKANSLTQLKRYDEALALYDTVLSINPNYAEAHSNKSTCLRFMLEYTRAFESAQKAISLKSDHPEAWGNLAEIFYENRLYDQAIESFINARSLDISIAFIDGIILGIQEVIGDWSSYALKISQLPAEIESSKEVLLPFSALSMFDDPTLQLKSSKIWANATHPPQDSLGPILKHNHPKIKVAYFSADFKDHAVSYLTAELFELHDRNQFEVYAFSLKRNQSAIRERLVAGFDHFIEVDDKTDIEIATLVRNLEIDIAVDLGGHTQDARTGIFSYRAAPIQVNFLGFAGTMGASYMDYIVADKVVIPPEHQQYYLEKKVYLPNSYMVDDSKRVPSNKQFSRSEFGLPENGAIFCCFNNSYKFNPPRVASFAKILTKTPNSVLWVSENNASFKKNLLAEFAKLGVPENRIVFAGRVNALEDHLARYRLADLFLDTSPYNAHTTALDSLKAGVPIITLAGKAFASRVGASLLTAIGLPELITNSEEEFVELASQLGQDAQKLKLLKDKLAANYLTMPLFNSKLFCKHLEAAYQEMHRHYINDLPPSDIYIK